MPQLAQWRKTVDTWKRSSQMLVQMRKASIAHIPRLHPQNSDCLGLGCCLGTCIFKRWYQVTLDFHLKDEQWAFGTILEWYLGLPFPVGILCIMSYCLWDWAMLARTGGNGQVLYGAYSCCYGREVFPPQAHEESLDWVMGTSFCISSTKIQLK